MLDAEPKTDDQRTVASMMRDLRVDPTDATTRLVLADFLQDTYPDDDFGQRLEAALRAGKVLPIALDVAALRATVINPHCFPEMSKSDRRWGSRRTVQAAAYSSGPLVATNYARLWQIVWRYRLLVFNKVVLAEAEIVHQIRQERANS